MFINDSQIKEEFKRKLESTFNCLRNEKTTYQNVCDDIKAALKRKFYSTKYPY